MNKTSYIHVDSSQRTIYPTNVYDKLYNLPPDALRFTDGTSRVTVDFDSHPFKPNDLITLGNVVAKNLILSGPITIKRFSKFARIEHQAHGLSLNGLFNPTDPAQFVKVDYLDTLPMTFDHDDNIPDQSDQYILGTETNLSVHLTNVQSDSAQLNLTSLNGTKRVHLIFTRRANGFVQDPDSYAIMLDTMATQNYTNANNLVHIKLCNLYGIPLTHLNSGLPIDQTRKFPYLTVVDSTANTFDVDVGFTAVVDPSMNSNCGGGTQMYVRRVRMTQPGDPKSNSYTLRLDRTFSRVTSAKIIGSVFPNSQRVISGKLYWRNLDDAAHLYQLEVVPGNYSPDQLASEIETKFAHTIRHQYAKTSNHDMYDSNGIYKYHIVDVSIDESTDFVRFNSYGEILLKDQPTGPVISVHDNEIEFTMGFDIRVDFSNNIVPFKVKSFDPATEKLFIYFTANSHQFINRDFPYAYNNLYTYTSSVSSTGTSHSFNAQLDTTTRILYNFNRQIGAYPTKSQKHQITSINTNTILTNFEYDPINQQVLLYAHHLTVGDIVVTDQFNQVNSIGELFVYEVNAIIDVNTFTVNRFPHGTKYKFIFDSIIINFGTDRLAPSHYWLDQIVPDEDIVHHTLSFTSIIPQQNYNQIMRIRHPSHQLDVGNTIRIKNSGSINRVPETAINTIHHIHRIIDENNYEIILQNYAPIDSYTMEDPIRLNVVAICYSKKFQLMFNFADTIGKLLGFSKVGETIAITPYAHEITNRTPYLNDYNYDVLGDVYNAQLPKLSMTGYDYFYLCCEEFGSVSNPISNTKPVRNVFAIIRWCDIPGSVVFDSFVPTIAYFDPPIKTLNELRIRIYHPDGNLVEFNGLDHSFTIELIESNESNGTIVEMNPSN